MVKTESLRHNMEKNDAYDNNNDNSNVDGNVPRHWEWSSCTENCCFDLRTVILQQFSTKRADSSFPFFLLHEHI